MADTTQLVPGIDVLVVTHPPRGSYPDVAEAIVDGEMLLEKVQNNIALIRGLQQVAVVSKKPLELLPGVMPVIDDADDGGAVGAIAAGIRALWHRPAATTAICSVWHPDTATMLEDLAQELNAEDGCSIACAEDADHQPNALVSVWDTPALWRVFEFMGPHPDPDPFTLLEGHAVLALDFGDVAYQVRPEDVASKKTHSRKRQ